MLKRIYLAGFFIAWNAAITAYANSTFLEKIVDVKNIGFIYTISSILTLIGIGILPRIIRNIGNRKTVLFISVLSIGALSMMIILPPSIISCIYFILYLMSNTLLYFCIDIFIEHYSKDSDTGKIRGAYLSLINSAWIISPFLSGILIKNYDFKGLYTFALITITILNIIVLIGLRKYKDQVYEKVSFLKEISELYKNKPVLKITILNFILQSFFAVMVVYSVIYMQEFHDLTWKSIAPILTTMLIPFVVIGYPLGRLVDKKILREKSIIIFGLLLMSLSVFFFARVPHGNVLLLTLCLFLSRVGAASVEAANEMYFFKHIDDGKTYFLSLFRDTIPLAYTIIPIVASIVLRNYTIATLFSALSVFILLGYIVVPFLNYEKEN